MKGKQSVIQYEANLGWPFSGPADYQDPAVYAVFALHNPNFSGKQIVEQLQEEFDKLGAAPVDAKELARARTFLRAAQIKELQSTMARARLLAQHEYFDGDPGVLSTELDRALAVTPAQIQAAVKKYLTAGKRAVLTITPAPKAPAKEGQ